MAAVTLEADGVKIEAWAENDGDVHLSIDGGDDVLLSPASAKILGYAFLQLSEPDDG